MRVRVSSIDRGGEPKVVELEPYLASTSYRPSNPIHAETRVFTARGSREPYDLHWNDSGIPGEELLGRYGLAASPEIVSRVAGELAERRAVRLFIFNSDADVCWQDLLELSS